MKGQCLCGSVKFELSIEKLKVYQCFCSLCQQQSGTESNFATIVPQEKFAFLSGHDAIKEWVKDTGFTSHFCGECGSPVPNRLRAMPYYWVPVGLLAQSESGTLVSHIYTGSKRELHHADNIEQFSEFPEDGLNAHIQMLCGESQE